MIQFSDLHMHHVTQMCLLIVIFYHFILLKISCKKIIGLFNLYNQDYGCWWPGNARGEGINSHDVYLNIVEYSVLNRSGKHIESNWKYSDYFSD